MWICNNCGKWHDDNKCPDCNSVEKIDSDLFFENELRENNTENYPDGELFYIEY